MTAWVDKLHAKASIVHDQIMAAKEMQRLSGVDTSGITANNWRLLDKLYAEELPFARLLDTSDILLHAEGPDASSALPTLRAVNWLCQTAEKQFKLLAKSTFDLSEADAHFLANKIDLRMTGFAPGSVYFGFSLQAQASSELIDGETEPVFALIRNTISQLPEIPRFIDDEAINASIREEIPDSAIRDAMLNAAMHLSPTGRIGIHTVELSSPLTRRPPAGLSQRERVVIREALNRPKLVSPKKGSFTGQIREIDLDAKRFHLRSIKDCGSLRCIFPEHYKEQEFKGVLGAMVSVSGYYEENKDGKPRLLLVERIEEIRQPQQHRLN